MVNKKEETEMEDNKIWLIFCAIGLVALTALVVSSRYEAKIADMNETDETVVIENITNVINYITSVNETYMNVSVYPQINFTPVLNLTVEKEHIVIQIHQNCVLPLTNVSQNLTNVSQSNTTNSTVGNTTATNSSGSNETEWICREEKRKNKKD